jgi:DNA replication protein DnaC
MRSPLQQQQPKQQQLLVEAGDNLDTNAERALRMALEQRWPELNEEQLSAMLLVQNDQNVFITGAGGVGKTYLLRCIIEMLQDRYVGWRQVTPLWLESGRWIPAI